MNPARFAAALFPQHRGGADAVLDACAAADRQAAELERLRDENTEMRVRVQELECEREQLLDRIEELAREKKDDRPKVMCNG